MRSPLICLALLTACGPTSPQPDDTLVGVWGGRQMELKANASEAVLVLRCISVRLPPIVLDQLGHFDVIGTVVFATTSGAIGSEFRVDGTIDGPVMAMFGRVRLDDGWSEPTLDSLIKGIEGDFSPPRGFCTN